MKKKNNDFAPLNLAQALRKYRLQAGLTQKSVSEALGITRSAYTYYETGKTSPDPTTLFRIARIFDVPLDSLFVGAESEPRTEVTLRDAGAPRRRVPKKVRADPQKIGELTPDEKCMIAFLRGRGLDVRETLERLKVWSSGEEY